MLSNFKPKFSCSIISGNPQEFFGQVKLLEDLGIDSFHFDVMDGNFVPRFGLYPEYLIELNQITKLPIDVHLMSINPEPYLEQFAKAGATRITPHVEPMLHGHRTITKIKNLGIEVGLALNPGTALDNVVPLLEILDSVTLMAINPGIVGHTFINSAYNRISKLRKLILEYNPSVELVVDGGVTFYNAAEIYSSGADTIVCGAGTVFNNSSTIEGNMQKLFHEFI